MQKRLLSAMKFYTANIQNILIKLSFQITSGRVALGNTIVDIFNLNIYLLKQINNTAQI